MKRRKATDLLFHKHKGECWYCYIPTVLMTHPPSGPHPLDMATKDHRVPRSRGGKSHPSNYVLACFECNTKKGDRTEPEFLMQEYLWLKQKRSQKPCGGT